MGPHSARGERPFDDTTDPADLTPQQRLGEAAAILASGLRRLRARGLASADGADAAAESSGSRLARCSGTWLHGHAAVDAAENGERP